MRFQGLHFNDEAVRFKIKNVLELCKTISKEGPQRIDAATWRDTLGQGEAGKILRQVFVKTHNGVSRGSNPQPAEWTVNRRAYNDLIASYKFYLGDKNDLEEIFFAEEKARRESKTEIEAQYRAAATQHAILEH